MTSKYRSIILLSLLALGGPARAHTDDLLIPSSKWVVDYADNGCRLTRQFGAGPKALTLRIARGASFSQYDIVLAGKSIAKLQRELEISLAIADRALGPDIISGYSMAVPDEDTRFIRMFDTEPQILEQLSDSDVLMIGAGGDVHFALRLDDGRKALSALAVCHDDLLKSWGLNRADFAAYKSTPKIPKFASPWVTHADYPSGAIYREQSGTVKYLLLIDATGKVEECRVLVSSRVANLDEITCRLINSRARFEPAIGPDGQPAKGNFISSVRWEIL